MKIQEVKVKTVDTDKLIAFLDIKLEKNQSVEIKRFCVFEDLYKIDADCCFSTIQKYRIDEVIQNALELEIRIKTRTSENTYITMAPAFLMVIPLLQYLALATEVNLTDFIRYNYNSRIQSNQVLLMKYINTK